MKYLLFLIPIAFIGIAGNQFYKMSDTGGSAMFEAGDCIVSSSSLEDYERTKDEWEDSSMDHVKIIAKGSHSYKTERTIGKTKYLHSLRFGWAYMYERIKCPVEKTPEEIKASLPFKVGDCISRRESKELIPYEVILQEDDSEWKTRRHYAPGLTRDSTVEYELSSYYKKIVCPIDPDGPDA